LLLKSFSFLSPPSFFLLDKLVPIALNSGSYGDWMIEDPYFEKSQENLFGIVLASLLFPLKNWTRYPTHLIVRWYDVALSVIVNGKDMFIALVSYFV
jgi:hypothetical protein